MDKKVKIGDVYVFFSRLNSKTNGWLESLEIELYIKTLFWILDNY